MSRAIRCKRIINGKTYNTETSTRLAGWSEFPTNTRSLSGKISIRTVWERSSFTSGAMTALTGRTKTLSP